MRFQTESTSADQQVSFHAQSIPAGLVPFRDRQAVLLPSLADLQRDLQRCRLTRRRCRHSQRIGSDRRPWIPGRRRTRSADAGAAPQQRTKCQQQHNCAQLDRPPLPPRPGDQQRQRRQQQRIREPGGSRKRQCHCCRRCSRDGQCARTRRLVTHAVVRLRRKAAAGHGDSRACEVGEGECCGTAAAGRRNADRGRTGR